ncbi:unnamed protein product [Mesocestoides corti]|uniref:Arrestin C-terminal-like domain-containing protein n=1 Tax=Mesocestoides corti TaxID=53468 RepID=A0A0R3U528_MESCO|nr:unnamed protein product [Mesocestoides corti]
MFNCLEPVSITSAGCHCYEVSYKLRVALELGSHAPCHNQGYLPVCRQASKKKTVISASLHSSPEHCIRNQRACTLTGHESAIGSISRGSDWRLGPTRQAEAGVWANTVERRDLRPFAKGSDTATQTTDNTCDWISTTVLSSTSGQIGTESTYSGPPGGHAKRRAEREHKHRSRQMFPPALSPPNFELGSVAEQ